MTSLTDRRIAAHVLRAMASSQLKRRPIHLDALAVAIGVRRADVRTVVSQLHREGHVDAQRMRVTMSGLAVATAMRECKLAEPFQIPAAPESRVA